MFVLGRFAPFGVKAIVVEPPAYFCKSFVMFCVVFQILVLIRIGCRCGIVCVGDSNIIYSVGSPDS